MWKTMHELAYCELGKIVETRNLTMHGTTVERGKELCLMLDASLSHTMSSCTFIQLSAQFSSVATV